MGDPMKETIQRFLARMQEQYVVKGAMLTGSYVSGAMMPNSDIDVFFIWDRQQESMRGRTFFEGVEFEYFFSPEWKYYDRLKADLVSQRVYASGRIVLDTEGVFERVQQAARQKVRDFAPRMSVQEKMDWSFHIETVMKDGIDLLEAGKKSDFCYLAGRHVPQFCDVAAKMLGKYPAYGKYAMAQLGEIDLTLAKCVEGIYAASSESDLLCEWKRLCRHVLGLLGDIDISDYQSITPITNKEIV
jgi:predicted nucleotidyltransferase